MNRKSTIDKILKAKEVLKSAPLPSEWNPFFSYEVPMLGKITRTFEPSGPRKIFFETNSDGRVNWLYDKFKDHCGVE